MPYLENTCQYKVCSIKSYDQGNIHSSIAIYYLLRKMSYLCENTLFPTPVNWRHMWNFTNFSPKRGSRSNKKNYANVTFYHNNKFWTEQESKKMYSERHVFDFWTTNIRHSSAITCLQVIHSMLQLSSCCSILLWTINNKVRDIFIVLFNTVHNFKWNQFCTGLLNKNVEFFFLLYTRNTAPQILLNISSSTFPLLQLLRGVILSSCIKTTPITFNSRFLFVFFYDNKVFHVMMTDMIYKIYSKNGL